MLQTAIFRDLSRGGVGEIMPPLLEQRVRRRADRVGRGRFAPDWLAHGIVEVDRQRKQDVPSGTRLPDTVVSLSRSASSMPDSRSASRSRYAALAWSSRTTSAPVCGAWPVCSCTALTACPGHSSPAPGRACRWPGQRAPVVPRRAEQGRARRPRVDPTGVATQLRLTHVRRRRAAGGDLTHRRAPQHDRDRGCLSQAAAPRPHPGGPRVRLCSPGVLLESRLADVRHGAGLAGGPLYISSCISAGPKCAPR